MLFLQSISPGAVNTDMVPEEFIKVMPDKEVILQTADVSNAVVFALSCPRSVEVRILIPNEAILFFSFCTLLLCCRSASSPSRQPESPFERFKNKQVGHSILDYILSSENKFLLVFFSESLQVVEHHIGPNFSFCRCRHH